MSVGMEAVTAVGPLPSSSELGFFTLAQLSRAIRERHLSSVEVVEALLERIERYNPALNAIVTLDAAGARSRAQEADAALARGETWGPLHGIPVTVKDAFETAGIRTTSSFRPLARYVPEHDATAVARLKAAGAIVLGKTNMPMLAMDGQSNSPIFGRANNPWDIGRTPGGSTGGGAAAVAAGLSPLELGSDLVGSIRQPAGFCGVFGLKPSEHRVSWAGHIPEVPGTPNSVRYMQTVGALARSVEDLRLCLEVIAGPDGRKWEVAPVPLEEPTPRTLASLRLAWWDDFGAPLSADCRRALEGLADDLTRAGCQVERERPDDFDFALAWRTGGEIVGVQAGVGMNAFVRMAMRAQLMLMGRGHPLTKGFVRGVGLGARTYFEALTRRDELVRSMESFLSGRDGWLVPVSATPAYVHCRSTAPLSVDGVKANQMFANIAYTCVFNVTGSPVVVLPVGHSGEGLPIAVQLVGRRWHDLDLLAVAERVSEVSGPFRRPPGY